ncbi:MAG TPA: hypothetical protein VF283_21995 [Bryobacteraceae bacterium]
MQIGAIFVLSLQRMLQVPAYIDPGTGALIWQSIAAAFIGGLFYFRKIIAKIKSFKFKKEKD